jgi:hypothetical protein
MSDDDRLTQLEKENAALKARLDALEKPKPVEPFDAGPAWSGPRFDFTANASMDASTMRAMADAVGDGVLGGVVNDRFRRMEPSSIISKETKVEQAKGTGWQDERPLEMPPGVKIIDQMMDAEDEMWRRDRARQFAGVMKKEDKP